MKWFYTDFVRLFHYLKKTFGKYIKKIKKHTKIMENIRKSHIKLEISMKNLKNKKIIKFY